MPSQPLRGCSQPRSLGSSSLRSHYGRSRVVSGRRTSCCCCCPGSNLDFFVCSIFFYPLCPSFLVLGSLLPCPSPSFFPGCCAACAGKNEAFRICILVLTARDLHLDGVPPALFPPLDAGLGGELSAGSGCGRSCTRAFRILPPLPATSPAPTTSSAPHPVLPATLCLGSGPGDGGGVGNRAGPDAPPNSALPSLPHPTLAASLAPENEWAGASWWRTLVRPRGFGGRGALVLGRPPSAAVPSFLPGGAARAWAGKEGAGAGWGGGRKARGGGRRGRKRRAGRPPLHTRAGPAGRWPDLAPAPPGAPAGPHPPTSRPRAAAAAELAGAAPAPRAPSRGRLWAHANWDGRGRRELARGSFPLETQSFSSRRRAGGRVSSLPGEQMRVGSGGRPWPRPGSGSWERGSPAPPALG